MTTPAPGWYPDPQNPSALFRYWDGAQWTSHTRPAPAAAPQNGAGAAVAAPVPTPAMAAAPAQSAPDGSSRPVRSMTSAPGVDSLPGVGAVPYAGQAGAPAAAPPGAAPATTGGLVGYGTRFVGFAVLQGVTIGFQGISRLLPVGAIQLIPLLLSLAWFGLNLWGVASTGQHFGHFVAGVQMRREGAPGLGFGMALLREVVKVIGFLVVGAGWWWVFIDKQNRTWHDIVSGSTPVAATKVDKPHIGAWVKSIF